MLQGLRSLGMAVLAVTGVGTAAASDDAWRAALETWRDQRAAELVAEDGWLSLTGLFWLPDEGGLCFGSGRDADVRLRAPVPERAGRIRLRDGSVEVQLEPGVDAELTAGDASGWRALRTDADGEPDRLRFGSQRFHAIVRGERVGVRLVDDEAETRARFSGLDWYPPDPAWRIRARFVVHPEPRTLRVPSVIGDVAERESPGYAVFEVRGREVRLHPVTSTSTSNDEERLFFIFKDATSGRGTYGAGRFLYAALPEDGEVELDFNRAYSPPCAFTLYATCPLPPQENRLEIAVEAGEKDPHLHH